MKTICITLAATLALGALAGCVSSTKETALDAREDLVPVDIAELREEMKARPDRMLHLIEKTDGKRKRSVHLRQDDHYFENNRFTWVPEGTGFYKPRVFTGYSGLSGNRVCGNPKDNWTGICLSLWRDPSGRLFLEYKLGNGRKGSFFVSPPLEAPNKSKLSV